ncbi:unnamed protein product [Rotaria sordida]|uniref:C2 domain-containing protein n=1 Tax=Rotaria sordida TaxID=392033 RepID=A0A813TG24_9BILA|nr:unnamed protein product [Rotaria sordida]CAF0808864.1 unnamed protein product [Rotaria sordida]
MLSPNYCSCTVNQARNLLDKSKNGLDPFCTISMGKEKFQTAVCEKTCSPDWHEQCDMPIVDDARIKLTVYHKSKNSLSKENFIGRAYISLRDLHDYDRVHTNWYKLTDKDGKLDKDRGEIEVSLQFYSQNNTTGSVLDLATKKKHLSLKDIRHSLSEKLKPSKHRKQDQYGNANQLADQRHRLGGDDGSVNNVRRLDDSTSESVSFVGSYTSLNSLPYNDTKQQKKKSRAPSSGIGSTLDSETPYSSRRSITSDYETSSILDSASMYAGEETSIPSPSNRPQIQEQHREEISVDDNLLSSNPSNKKKTKEPLPSLNVPTIIINESSNSPSLPISTDYNRKISITGDDIEAAFDFVDDNKTAINKSKDYEITSTSDSFFGLSTIKEILDTDETILSSTSSKHLKDEEIDFSNYFNRINQTNDDKKTKKSALDILKSKFIHHSKEQQHSIRSQSDDIQTPSASISVKLNTTSNSSITLPTKKQSNDINDSTDEDVDEVLGTLERISSMRSSVRRRIQPRDDIIQQSLSETDNKWSNGNDQTLSNRNTKLTLPDIVGQPSVKNPSQYTTSSGPKKLTNNGLCVLGYENIKSVPINPKIRQELDYLDREELLHVIAYQSDLIKKRDTRLKDLECYTDGLLVKIVEQCPTILQNGTTIRIKRKP